MSIYLVDTNFFIQAHRAYYPLDVAISFWNKVRQLAEEEKIISIDKVKSELYKNEDDLKKWCDSNLSAGFFKDTEQAFTNYSKVANWAISKNGHYLPQALAEFLNTDVADAWLIAFALKNITSTVIVTYEISQPKRKSKIKIPDVCCDFNVSYLNTIEMFRQMNVQF